MNSKANDSMIIWDRSWLPIPYNLVFYQSKTATGNNYNIQENLAQILVDILFAVLDLIVQLKLNRIEFTVPLSL